MCGCCSAGSTERILPLFSASLEVAAAAGDLRPDRGQPPNAFWFAHHVAAMTAYRPAERPLGRTPSGGRR